MKVQKMGSLKTLALVRIVRILVCTCGPFVDVAAGYESPNFILEAKLMCRDGMGTLVPHYPSRWKQTNIQVEPCESLHMR
jgi:hypothetical protein